MNLLEPGDQVIIGVNGVFGERMCEVARRAGRRSRASRRRGAARSTPPRCSTRSGHGPTPGFVAVVHAETSTGVENPIAPLAALQEHRHAPPRRHRHVARRDPARGRRLGDRRRLLGHPEVPRRPAGSLAGHVLAAGRRPHPHPGDAAAVVVPRPRPHRRLRRRGPQVPPHRADRDDLRPPRRSRRGPRRGPPRGVGAPPRGRRAPAAQPPRAGLHAAGRGGPPPPAAHVGRAAAGRRRRRPPQGPARGVGHRGRRRARGVRGHRVAHRAHGSLGAGALGDDAARCARPSCSAEEEVVDAGIRAKLGAFVATTDVEAARAFYGETLGSAPRRRHRVRARLRRRTARRCG